jgi:hypothetical protein
VKSGKDKAMKTITALLILLSAMPAAAVGVETLIAPMAEPLQAGQKTTIGIYIHNTGKRRGDSTF